VKELFKMNLRQLIFYHVYGIGRCLTKTEVRAIVKEVLDTLESEEVA